jgi:hypothetical protein
MVPRVLYRVRCAVLDMSFPVLPDILVCARSMRSCGGRSWKRSDIASKALFLCWSLRVTRHCHLDFRTELELKPVPLG